MAEVGERPLYADCIRNSSWSPATCFVTDQPYGRRHVRGSPIGCDPVSLVSNGSRMNAWIHVREGFDA